MDLYFNILDQKRISILPKLANFKEDFYLAGGTALALYFGHRDSVDFDFFSSKSFSVERLVSKIEKVFSGHKILIIQKEIGTLTVILDDEIKISFFEYDYCLIAQVVESEYMILASIPDIACMKLSAICSRSLYKDYLDLFFIFQKFSLSQLLQFCKDKFPSLDEQVILKSLLYFEDIEMEPVIIKNGLEVSLAEIKSVFTKIVKEYMNYLVAK
jgi:predicted nucleotidyltransferase component of viral defense system